MHRLTYRRARTLRIALTATIAGVLLAAPGATAAPFKVGIQSNGTLVVSSLTSEQRAQNLDAIAGTGAKVLRLTVSWKFIATNACAGQTPAQLEDPNHPCYNWAMYDELVSGARARGMEVLGSVYEIPQWVNESEDARWTGATDSYFDTRVVPHWAAFQKAAAARYSQFSSMGFVRYWTVHNEPNSAMFWTPIKTSPTRYPRLFRAVAPKIKEGSGASLVGLGPTGPRSTIKPGTWYRTALPLLAKNGSARYINAVAHNPYSPSALGPRQRTTRFPDLGPANLNDLIVLLDSSKATRKKPLWMTEFAWQTYPQDRLVGTSWTNQAAFMAELLDLMHATKRVHIAIWYGYVDPTDPADWQSGFIAANGRVKPIAEMYKRPISLSASRVRKGQSVRVWGMSLTAPGSQQLQMSMDGRRWKKVRGQRMQANGVVYANVRLTKKTFFRTKDRRGAGPRRVLTVR